MTDWTDVVERVARAIEIHIGDVCEGLSPNESWEETFHLAHDWLIDNKHYRPETNETIALEVADRFFTQEK
jgi:hypothetical protein